MHTHEVKGGPAATEPELVVEARARLGEGPVWDADRQQLYWVNIFDREVHLFNPRQKTDRIFRVAEPVGAVALRDRGGLVAALQTGLYFLDEALDHGTLIAAPEHHPADHRFNDAKCDPAGRFWAGTMQWDGAAPGAGSLYRLDTDLSLREIVHGVTISNGMAWDPGGKIMYYIDTPTREVWAFDYDIETGGITNRRTALSFSAEDGFPDGMTIDAHGMLWVALWDGWKVVRCHPQTGERLGEIKLPVSRVTCCTFGGEALDELYITSARIGLTGDELARQPQAGGLFRARVGARGLRASKFLG